MGSIADRHICSICRSEPEEAEVSTHYISIDPRIMSGASCINHRRIPVTILANFFLAGDSIEDIAENYGLHRNDVLVAIWYLGIYGRLKRWRAWRHWAQGMEGLMWAGEWDKVSDPPREDGKRK